MGRQRKKVRREDLVDKQESELTSLLFGAPSAKSQVADFDNGETDGHAIETKELSDEEGSTEEVQEKTAAWEDDDDDDFFTSEDFSSHRLKKLRKSRQETASEVKSDLEERLRKQYQNTSLLSSRTEWANVDKAQKARDDDDDSVDALLTSSRKLLADSSDGHIPSDSLNIVRVKDANEADPSAAVIRCAKFHPGSDPDEPLLMTAGLDKTMRFFQVGADESKKVHGIHFPRMPIYNASFLMDSGNVVATGRRPFFYLYDMVAGKIDLVPSIYGREEKSWESHAVSPDGKIIALLGNDGYIILVDPRHKQAIGSLKINGSVRAVTFDADGRYLLASGSDGDVYRWDVHSRKCIGRFSNDDGTITSSLAVSGGYMAVGAESGVVNLYKDTQMAQTKPIKSAMNLRTAVDGLQFSHDGQILAMSSRFADNGLKLMHVPSKTVFSNWPTSKTPLKYVFSTDFSPMSKYFAIGNDKGKCLLYRLKAN